MGIEEQIREIAKEALETQLIDIDKQLKSSFRSDTIQLKEQIERLNTSLDEILARIEGMNGRIGKLEEELNNRWSLVVKLRKYTLDQLMSEYKRLTGQMRPEQEDSVENAEI
jgi:peptidoglycan hydrolase CwlO-like protein